MPPRYLSVIVPLPHRPAPTPAELRQFTARLQHSLDGTELAYELLLVSESPSLELGRTLLELQRKRPDDIRILCLPAQRNRQQALLIAAAQARGALTWAVDSHSKNPGERLRRLLQVQDEPQLRQGSLLDALLPPSAPEAEPLPVGHDDPFGPGASDLPSAARLA